MSLTNELINEHKTLLEVLEKAVNADPCSSERRDLLTTAKNALLAHLEKEGRDLYPMLNKEAETNGGLAGILKVLTQDMDKLAPVAMAFFDKYTGADCDDTNFAQDISEVIFALKTRIRREEQTLYPEYDKIA